MTLEIAIELSQMVKKTVEETKGNYALFLKRCYVVKIKGIKGDASLFYGDSALNYIAFLDFNLWLRTVPQCWQCSHQSPSLLCDPRFYCTPVC